MREMHASSSIHVHVVKFMKCLNYYTSACLSVLGGNIMRETHASSSIHAHVVKFIKCLNYYTSACLSVLGGNKELSSFQ